MIQPSLFDPENLARTSVIPPAPTLVPHSWPYPGMTPENSARAAVANSEDYFAMLAAVIHSQPGSELTAKQVLSMVPDDWRVLCGQYAHGRLDIRQGRELGVLVKYVPHDDSGFHFSYQAMGQAQAHA